MKLIASSHYRHGQDKYISSGHVRVVVKNYYNYYVESPSEKLRLVDHSVDESRIPVSRLFHTVNVCSSTVNPELGAVYCVVNSVGQPDHNQLNIVTSDLTSNSRIPQHMKLRPPALSRSLIMLHSTE